jgi:ferric-dicitrate binding protein FerR (iron transport regulator)
MNHDIERNEHIRVFLTRRAAPRRAAPRRARLPRLTCASQKHDDAVTVMLESLSVVASTKAPAGRCSSPMPPSRKPGRLPAGPRAQALACAARCRTRGAARHGFVVVADVPTRAMPSRATRAAGESAG